MEAKAEVEAEKEIENRDVEEETNEVEFLEEVKKKEKEEVIERRKERKDVRGNVDPWGPTDRRIKEVRAEL